MLRDPIVDNEPLWLQTDAFVYKGPS